MTWNRVVAAGLLVALLISMGAVESSASEPSPAHPPVTAGDNAAAAVSDVFCVPGKAIVCGVSGVLWVATMGLTFGTLYNEATDFVKGGCGGTWVLTGEDIESRRSH